MHALFPSASRSAASSPTTPTPPAGRDATVTVSVRVKATPSLDVAGVVLDAFQSAAVLAEDRGEPVHWRVALLGPSGLLDAVRGVAWPEANGQVMDVVFTPAPAPEPEPEPERPKAAIRHHRDGGATVDGVRLSAAEARHL